MVEIARKAARPVALRYLNQPRSLQVLLDPHGAPRMVVLGRKAHRIRTIRDRRRVDDTWWREPLCRMYFELELEDGRIITLFQDRIADQWYEQRYG